MIRRAVDTFSELTLWLLVLAMLIGCSSDRTQDATGATTNKDGKTDSMQAKLIPRDVLFGNPQRAGARLSPDGKYLSFLAPVDNVLNVWVGPPDDITKAVAVTEEKIRPIRGYNWAYDSKHILYS